MPTGPPLDFPVIESERLTIRVAEPEDAVDINRAIAESFESLHRWMDWAKEVPSLEETRARIERARQVVPAGEDIPVFLFEKGTRHVVGASGLHQPDWEIRRFEIGYWVRSCHEGQGFVTEAVRAITEFALSEYGARRLEIRMSTHNLRSRAVAERAGYRLEATLRKDRVHPDGSLGDTWLWARVPLKTS